jgi:hypothetical protein
MKVAMYLMGKTGAGGKPYIAALKFYLRKCPIYVRTNM